MALQSTTALSAITLQSSSSTVTFSSIPATYRDLILVIDGTVSAGGGEVVRVNFNGDTVSGNYPTTYMDGNGSTASSGSDNRRVGLIYPSRTNMVIQFQDYSTTDKRKPWISRVSGAGNVVFAASGRWVTISPAINTISIFTDANAFAAGSTFSLFGVIA